MLEGMPPHNPTHLMRLVTDEATARRIHLDMAEAEIAKRRAEMLARGTRAWRPATRKRKVSAALKAYGMLAMSADKGAARDLGLLPEDE